MYSVGDVIRHENYETVGGGWRVWKVVGVYLGGAKQEGTYELLPLDLMENKPIQVPTVILDMSTSVEWVARGSGKWQS